MKNIADPASSPESRGHEQHAQARGDARSEAIGVATAYGPAHFLQGASSGWRRMAHLPVQNWRSGS